MLFCNNRSKKERLRDRILIKKKINHSFYLQTVQCTVNQAGRRQRQGPGKTGKRSETNTITNNWKKAGIPDSGHKDKLALRQRSAQTKYTRREG